MFDRLRDWLALADYEDAKKAATDDLIARFSRRNVSIQNGWHMDDDDIHTLSLEGDRALESITKIIAASGNHAN
jgi:hypothetical protein